MPLLADDGFLLFSFCVLAGTFGGVLVLTHQNDTFCKERFFRGVASAAVKQTVLAVIILSIFGNTGNGLFQDFFNRLYRLSPSLNV